MSSRLMTWMTKCEACDGKGERYADPRGDENGKGLKLIRCPVCRGTGEVPVNG